jgi:hypothetical protein
VGDDVLREPGPMGDAVTDGQQIPPEHLAPEQASPMVGLARKSIGKADELLKAAKK